MIHSLTKKIIWPRWKKLHCLKYISVWLFFLFSKSAIAQSTWSNALWEKEVVSFIPTWYKEVEPLPNSIFRPAHFKLNPDTVELWLRRKQELWKVLEQQSTWKNTKDQLLSEQRFHKVEQDSSNYIYVTSKSLVRWSYKWYPFNSGEIQEVFTGIDYTVSEITVKELFAPGQKDSLQFLIIQTPAKTLFTWKVINRRWNLAIIRERIGAHFQEQKLSFMSDSIYYTGAWSIASLPQTQIINPNIKQKSEKLSMDLHYFNSIWWIDCCIRNTEKFRDKTLETWVHTIFFVGSKSDHNGAFRCEENLWELYASSIYINLSTHNMDTVIQHINNSYPDRIFNFVITTHGIDYSNFEGKIQKPSSNDSQTLFSTNIGSQFLKPKEVLKKGANIVFILACQWWWGWWDNNNAVNSLAHNFQPNLIWWLRYAWDPKIHLTDKGIQVLVAPVYGTWIQFVHLDRIACSGFYLLEKEKK